MDERLAEADEDRLVVWRLLDGKPGHENQSLGLCQALAQRITVEQCDIVVPVRPAQFIQWLFGFFPAGKNLPCPDVVMGAGHNTHFALLAVKRRYGARAVVIMKPSLPLSLFDLCVVPEHDDVSGENVFVTRGVMNAVVSKGYNKRAQGLILLGGLSPHFEWDDNSVLAQIESIVRSTPSEPFVLTDSRRTPADFMEKLASRQLENLTLVPHQQTAQGWLVEQLGLSHSVWISEDSVSMVYEAITSGAAVGLITLGQARPGRVSKGIEKLVNEGWATPCAQWQQTGLIAPPPGAFNEASRCADWMVNQWL